MALRMNRQAGAKFQPRNLNQVPLRIPTVTQTDGKLGFQFNVQINAPIENILPQIPVEGLRKLYDALLTEFRRRDEKL